MDQYDEWRAEKDQQQIIHRFSAFSGGNKQQKKMELSD